MIEFNATFLVAMLSFVVFILIMNAIFYNPILGIIRKREDYINSNYENSKRFKAEAEEIKTTRNAKLEQTQDKCRHQFKNSVDEAQTIAANKIKAAKENTKQVIQSKKDKLALDESELKNTLENSVVRDLASSITTKILGIKNIDVNKVTD